MKNIERLIRPELLNLKPYSSARDEFKGKADVYIDANENPFNNTINRYPDPLQKDLKKRICEIKEVEVDQIFLGNGSDEVLDLIFRLFCTPGQDEIMITPPTYGMYKVLAGINNVFVKEVPLDTDFQVNVSGILKTYDRVTKILFLCSPNNPVGLSLDREPVESLIDQFPGIVVIDEAYIDFSEKESFINLIKTKSNVIVVQTLSKAWGMAGIRLGMAFSNPYLISQLNKIKPPYNVNVLTQREALERLQNTDEFSTNLATIKREKELMMIELNKLEIVKHVHESDANFILAKFEDADYYYDRLVKDGIVVRNRSKQHSCEGCLRITVGTPVENKTLIENLKK